jgi:hypothetical protein
MTWINHVSKIHFEVVRFSLTIPTGGERAGKGHQTIFDTHSIKIIGHVVHHSAFKLDLVSR